MAISPTFDLEKRTEDFAILARTTIYTSLPSYQYNEDAKQLIRSSGSVAANYIEANEALSKKDFRYRIKICLKEAKESRLWIRLLSKQVKPHHASEYKALEDESEQLIRIFSSILLKTKP